MDKSKWISVNERIDMEREDNCCMDPLDVERYGVPVLVFDEDCGEVLIAGYDFRERRWASYEGPLTGVTHWMRLPEPPVGQGEESRS